MSDNLQKGQLKQVIRSEFVKCAKNPAYFMKKYCQIQHPIRGKILFNLYDFQEKVLDDFVDHDYNIILKARQLGISTLVGSSTINPAPGVLDPVKFIVVFAATLVTP